MVATVYTRRNLRAASHRIGWTQAGGALGSLGLPRSIPFFTRAVVLGKEFQIYVLSTKNDHSGGRFLVASDFVSLILLVTPHKVHHMFKSIIQRNVFTSIRKAIFELQGSFGKASSHN